MNELIVALEKIAEYEYQEYLKLYELEKKGYNKLTILDQEKSIETLKKLKTFEDEIIEKLKERNEISQSTTYLKNKYRKDDKSIYIDVTLEKGGLIENRVYNRLVYELIDCEAKNDYSILNSDVIEKYLINDYLLLSLTILNKSLPNAYTKEILKIKYKLLYTIPLLEQTLIKDNFNLQEHPFITYKMLITNNKTKNFVTKYVEERLMNDINARLNLLATLNIEYIEENGDVYAAVIYLLATIRAALVLMDELELDEFITSIYIMIKKIADKFNKEYNRRILYQFAEDIQNDKSMPQILKLFR